jgi:SAM-dependent methyltransferase
VDRYYIESFLQEHRADIRGRILEIRDSTYTDQFGSAVETRDVLDIDPANPRATIVADLSAADQVPADSFDCILLTQTLQFVFDLRSAIGHTHRVLKPGGVVLVTVPATSRIAPRYGLTSDFWRFTPASINRLFGEVFGAENVLGRSYGNVLTSIASFRLAREELTQNELDVLDEHSPLSSLSAHQSRHHTLNRPACVEAMRGYLRRYWLEAWAITGLVAAAASPFVPLLRLRLPLSGAVSIYAEDQLQYFAWIREATTHILAGDRFDLAPGIRSFLHPVFALSGILHATSGLPIPLCYFLWEPVAIGLLAFAFSRYVRRLLPSKEQQAAALTLALFAISPFYLILRAFPGNGRDIAALTTDFSREVWIAGHLWGYQVTAIAAGLMPLVLLSLDSWRRTPRASPPLRAVLGTGLISWLHPWQGATLIVTLGIAEFLDRVRNRQRPRTGFLVIALAAAIPACYYVLLARLDPVWQIYQRQNAVIMRPLLPPLFAVLPLAVPASLAFRRRADDWQEVVVRVWPLAAFIMYFAPFSAFPSHALQGIALPLSILAVEGFTHVFRRPARAVVVADRASDTPSVGRQRMHRRRQSRVRRTRILHQT